MESYKEEPFIIASLCVPHFQTQIRNVSLRLLDDCPVGTGVTKPSNEVHEGIDVGEFLIINHEGHSKGSDNQLNQQTVFIVAIQLVNGSLFSLHNRKTQ